MWELGVFPNYLENDLLKVFLQGKKRLRRIQNGVLPFTVAKFCARCIVYHSRLFG